MDTNRFNIVIAGNVHLYPVNSGVLETRGYSFPYKGEGIKLADTVLMPVHLIWSN